MKLPQSMRTLHTIEIENIFGGENHFIVHQRLLSQHKHKNVMAEQKIHKSQVRIHRYQTR